MSEFRYVNPPNVGWLEISLDSNEIDYVWKRVKEKESSSESWKHKLAGDVHESKLLEDPDDWFFNNVILKCGETYHNIYYNMGKNLPIPDGDIHIIWIDGGLIINIKEILIPYTITLEFIVL